MKKLDQSRLKPKTIEILKTVLLGERSSLDHSTRDEFAKAGVVHLFAISGLHIGLLMLFFQTLFKSLSVLPKGKLWQNNGRKLPTTYLVLLSMGILLFLRPSFILQLGFQMSYLAVFGILFLSPLLQINFKWKAMQWFWQLTIVSLSAQIAVAPLSIFHFNQFPLLLLLSNWVILPFMGVVLVC